MLVCQFVRAVSQIREVRGFFFSAAFAERIWSVLTGTPRLSGSLVASLLAHGVRLPLVLGHTGVNAPTRGQTCWQC